MVKRNNPLLHCYLRRLSALLLIMVSHSSQAVQTGDTKKFTFTGKLIGTTQCTVNNDRVMDVPFGNVGITKVDSGKFVQPINYTLDCGNASQSNTITMSFLATPSSFDAQAMATNVSELGVRILKDGLPIDLNKGFKIATSTNKPKLEALLVKDPGRDLPEKPFSTTGTLIVEFF